MVFNHYATLSPQVQIMNLTIFKRNPQKKPPNVTDQKMACKFDKKKLVKIEF